jgi:hypothetical protein
MVRAISEVVRSADPASKTSAAPACARACKFNPLSKEFIMETIERRSERPATPVSSYGAGDTGPDPLYAAAAGLLSAADAAIQRALSHDSQAYLQSMRQEGGQ